MVGKPGPKRSQIQRELDRQTVAELTLKGWTRVAIAQHLELHHSSVSRDLAVIRKQWKETSVRDFNSDTQQELQRLSIIERECWAGWERSQESRETSVDEQIATGKDEAGRVLGRLKKAIRKEQKVGDVAFLTGVLKVVDSRCKLLGLYPSDADSASSQIQFSESQLNVIGGLMRETQGVNGSN